MLTLATQKEIVLAQRAAVNEVQDLERQRHDGGQRIQQLNRNIDVANRRLVEFPHRDRIDGPKGIKRCPAPSYNEKPMREGLMLQWTGC
jgi:hypothetical protein